MAKTGLVAVLDTEKPGKTIAFRADFDALPINELSQLPYNSKNKGKMHACGHDGHSAVLLCTAGILAKIKHKLTGKIKFIFQPAEELGDGAKAMIQEGVLDNPAVDAIYALHNFPKFPAGNIFVKSNTILAGMDSFEIEIQGVGGHGSLPEKCINPIFFATQLIIAIQDIANIRTYDPQAVINITQLESGNSLNITPDKVLLKILTRFSTKKAQDLLQEHIKKHIDVISKDQTIHINYKIAHTTPPTINTDKESKLVFNVAKSSVGKENVIWLDKTLAAYNDFAYYLEQIPGCYFLIGNGEDSEMVHTAHYNFNDRIIPQAAKIFVNIALAYSERQDEGSHS